MPTELSPDAIVVGQCLSPIDYRTRKELAELAYGKADNQTVHRVKIAYLELVENHHIYRQFSNEENGKIPVGWSYKFGLDGFRAFCTKEHTHPTCADCS